MQGGWCARLQARPSELAGAWSTLPKCVVRLGKKSWLIGQVWLWCRGVPRLWGTEACAVWRVL